MTEWDGRVRVIPITGEGRRWSRRCGSVAAQQLEVSAAHHADGVLDEADRLAADRGGLPSVARDRLGAVKRMGDLAIAGVGEMAVERADHQDEPPAMPPRDQPSFRRRTRRAADETSLEADQAEDAKPEIVVQWQQGGKLLAFAYCGKPHAMVARGVLDDDVKPVRITNARSCWREVGPAELMRP